MWMMVKMLSDSQNSQRSLLKQNWHYYWLVFGEVVVGFTYIDNVAMQMKSRCYVHIFYVYFNAENIYSCIVKWVMELSVTTTLRLISYFFQTASPHHSFVYFCGTCTSQVSCDLFNAGAFGCSDHIILHKLFA